jgi:hypothetical protein
LRHRTCGGRTTGAKRRDRRTSENPFKAKFGELIFQRLSGKSEGALPCVFGYKRRPMEAPSPTLGGPLAPDSGSLRFSKRFLYHVRWIASLLEVPLTNQNILFYTHNEIFGGLTSPRRRRRCTTTYCTRWRRSGSRSFEKMPLVPVWRDGLGSRGCGTSASSAVG